jgi:hypothetical protein
MSERAHLSADEILYCSRDTVGSNIIITTESRKSWLVSYAETGSVRKVKVLLARYPIFLSLFSLSVSSTGALVCWQNIY